MIEQDIITALRADSALMALLSNDANAVDLVDVAQDTKAPYLTMNVITAEQAGRGSLCGPSVGLLTGFLAITPWAPTAPLVKQINDAARAALFASSSLSVRFVRLEAWQREPETNLLMRPQVFSISFTE